MEFQVSDQGTFELVYDKLDLILHLLAMGFTIGVVVAVIVAGIRLGWKLMPYVVVAGILAFLLV